MQLHVLPKRPSVLFYIIINWAYDRAVNVGRKSNAILLSPETVSVCLVNSYHIIYGAQIPLSLLEDLVLRIGVRIHQII